MPVQRCSRERYPVLGISRGCDRRGTCSELGGVRKQESITEQEKRRESSPGCRARNKRGEMGREGRGPH
jgi:hypothetical protein